MLEDTKFAWRGSNSITDYNGAHKSYKEMNLGNQIYH